MEFQSRKISALEGTVKKYETRKKNCIMKCKWKNHEVLFLKKHNNYNLSEQHTRENSLQGDFTFQFPGQGFCSFVAKIESYTCWWTVITAKHTA